MNTVHAAEAVPLPPVGDCYTAHYGNDINGELSAGANGAKVFCADLLNMNTAINVARGSPNPLLTKRASEAEVERLVQDSEKTFINRLETVKASLNASLAEAESSLKQTVGIVRTGRTDRFQDRLIQLPPNERDAEMRKAFASRDKEVIAALVHGHSLEHGCDPDVIANLYDNYQREVAPAQYASVEAHNKYVGYLGKLGPEIMAFATRALQGTGGHAKKREATIAVLKSYGIEYKD